MPMPRVASFEELNRHLLAACRRDDVRVVHRQSVSIGQAWQEEQPYLRPLPSRPFACCVTRQAHLNGYSQVTYETNRYSVPTEQARQELTLKAYPFEVQILFEGTLLARHARCYGREQDVFDPLHYLWLLEQRPGAFAYARPLRQWRPDWPESYHRLLHTLRQTWPEGRGVKEFVRILRLHESAKAELVEQAVEQALSYGCPHLDGVKLCLEQLQVPTPPKSLLDLTNTPHLAEVGTQAVDLTCYEQLIERRVAQ